MNKISGVQYIKNGNEYVKSEIRKPEKVDTLYFDYIGGKNVMPIGGWWGPYVANNPVTDLTDLKYYEMIKQCGINFITVSKDDYREDKESCIKAFKYAEQTHLGIFAHDSQILEIDNVDEMRKRLNEYINNYKCILGIHVKDEPEPKKFDILERTFKLLWETGIKDKVFYTNLFAACHSVCFGVDNYKEPYLEYLDEFFEKIKCEFMSYDFYPFSFFNEGTNTSPKYFFNLSIARKYCREHHIPLWTFAQTGFWSGVGPKDEDKFPNENEMFWNINTCLAYGVKAIHYFTIIQPETYVYDKNSDKPDYRKSGLIGFDGKENRWYYYAKKINEHIAFVDEVLMNSQSMAVIPIGDVEKYMGEEKTYSFRELKQLEGHHAVIGCFDYQGKTCLYVVNNSTVSEDKISLTFDAERGFDIYNNLKKEEMYGKFINLELDAGQAVMIVVK